jgi:hypothetical protein
VQGVIHTPYWILRKWQLNHFDIVLREAFNNDTNGINNEHETRNGCFEVSSHNLLKPLDISSRRGLRNSQLIDECESATGGTPRRRSAMSVYRRGS